VSLTGLAQLKGTGHDFTMLCCQSACAIRAYNSGVRIKVIIIGSTLVHRLFTGYSRLRSLQIKANLKWQGCCISCLPSGLQILFNISLSVWCVCLAHLAKHATASSIWSPDLVRKKDVYHNVFLISTKAHFSAMNAFYTSVNEQYWQ